MRYFALILVVATASVYMIITSDMMRHQTVIINCGVSEISPDFTPEAREQCRRLRGQKP
jgi:hypothetical protein